MYKCPECGSADALTVEIKTTARLIQSGDNIETEITADHEWDDDSWMICDGCGHEGKAEGFEVEAKPPLEFNPVGFVEPRTGRVAVSVVDYVAHDGDTYAYWYWPGDDDLGLDPWRVVDSVDPATDGKTFDVWFETGSVPVTVGPEATLFVAEKDAHLFNKYEGGPGWQSVSRD